MAIVSRNIYLKRFFLALIFIIIVLVGIELFAPNASADPRNSKDETSLQYKAPYVMERSDQTTTTTTTTTTTAPKPLVKQDYKKTSAPVAAAPIVPLPSGTHNDWMIAAGIAESDFGYVEFIISKEGGWEPCKVNGGAIDCNYQGNRAYGMGQSLPGNKMAAYGDDWRTNPITQLKFIKAYCEGRYGSFAGAVNFWNRNHWY